MAGEDHLTKLNDKLSERQEARGQRGGLGRVKGPKPFASTFDTGPKWDPAGDDALYRRFTRGPVLGGTAEVTSEKGKQATAKVKGDDANSAAWREHIEAALRKEGGHMLWTTLQEAVVKRHRKKRKASQEPCTKEEEELWPQMALAHIPQTFLSRDDAFVRLPPELLNK
mmetsp:Transcript_13403/g.22039  ORF Transcript_13403/g.22039 Transcript_13403/m.22039 type:complete len:169 (+) Transcript_13403:34-540(+)